MSEVVEADIWQSSLRQKFLQLSVGTVGIHRGLRPKWIVKDPGRERFPLSIFQQLRCAGRQDDLPCAGVGLGISCHQQGLIPVNPADEVEPPKVIHQPMKILTEEQLNIFLKTIKADEFWYDFFYTELTTGLRRGEICGLMWIDFDERGGALKVCRTLHRETGGRLVAGDTKTYAGTRKIVLPPSTVELLRERKRKSFSPWIFHDPLRSQADAAVSPLSAFCHGFISSPR